MSDILDTRNLSFVGDFNTQMKEILQYIILPAENPMLQTVYKDLETFFQGIWRGIQFINLGEKYCKRGPEQKLSDPLLVPTVAVECGMRVAKSKERMADRGNLNGRGGGTVNILGCQIEVFGSIMIGLAMKNSDIDCLVNLPPNLRREPIILLRETEKALSQNTKFQIVNINTKSKKPLIVVLHKHTQISCDITFSDRNCIKICDLMIYLISRDDRIRPLMLTIKYWSKIYDLTGNKKMKNFCLQLLIVFYLQQKEILPSIKSLQQNIEEEITGLWNTAFARPISYSNDDTETVYTLLGGFFQYYSNFDFKNNIISLYLGHLIHRTDFEKRHYNEYNLYYNNIRQHLCKPLCTNSFVCVQDPFNHDRNSAITILPHVAMEIVNTFNVAASIYKNENEQDFLKKLLNGPDLNIARSMQTFTMEKMCKYSSSSVK
ncbi:unnamed protein product [Leptosia nina]|uniref:PAP-associated domain-containing protein n=1 Tax=Leptosia nina TaxID=320188 RepID=A0AAV1J1K9_9NEOP